ncbi:DUF3800 domain-containing protein [Candidatus Gottesmanbacteria bacterium]|nr:DUF3800 domain-containing protein [Candidatus Gottesmanbacteria bacterium]
MLLVYIDESGISYEKNKKGYFVDGPYAIWSGVLINDSKYFHIERSFFDLVEKYIQKSLRKEEIHASVLWNHANKKTTAFIIKERIKKYFEELFQLLAKFHVRVVFSVQQKNPGLGKGEGTSMDEELERARYSFLHILEHELALLNETGILIADFEKDDAPEHGKELKDQLNKMKDLVLQRTLWRVKGNPKKMPRLLPKFEFEYRSNFILDQLHYVDSKESPYIQLVDHICYVLRRALECIYLSNYANENRPICNPDIVPISESTFNFFVKASLCHFGFYNNDDVTFDSLSEQNIFAISFTRQPGGRLMISSMDQVLSKIKSFTPFG